MEYGLGLLIKKRAIALFFVLILVVMEYGLGLTHEYSYDERFMS